MTGYFFDGSKPRGLTMRAGSARPSAAGTVKSVAVWNWKDARISVRRGAMTARCAPVALWTQVRAHLRRLSVEVPAALLWQARQLAAPPPGLKLSYAPARVRGADETVATLSISDEAAGLRIDLRATRSPEGAASLAVSPVDVASASSGNI